MSADAWSICPKCARKADEESRGKVQKAAEAYGKVEAREYEKILKEARQPINLEETLRQDFEIWVDEDGKFTISFYAQCTETECDFKYQYKYEEQIMGKEEP